MIDGEKVWGTERNMRPGHSLCQPTEFVNEAQATAMWGIGMKAHGVLRSMGEQQHQRKLNKEVAKGDREKRSVKMDNKETREERGAVLFAGLQARNSPCFYAPCKCICCNSM